MALNVPEPVAACLAAEEAKDAEALSRCVMAVRNVLGPIGAISPKMLAPH